VGFHELTGWPDRPPVGPYGAYTDYCMPHLMASVVLAALDHRRRTGESGHLDFSQAEAALHYLSPAIVELQTTGRLPTRRGNDDPSASPHGVWPCAGEGFVALSCRTDEQRAALARLLGEQPLDAWMAARAAVDVQAELVAVGVAAHEVQGPAQADRDPQLAHLGHWIEVDHPVHGGLTVEATRFRLSRTPVGPRSAGPMLNQHRDEVLTGFLGYPAERVAGLDAAGVLS
jgi:benzylsuccinate CoA-transferase BbsF subunit